ncbi:class I SAM-dependent methyltransferase [Alicyclobacillus acidiphilus]|uniref:class I SAM-dependent methyltransferase n=1 Tax=Alicyclobacillus acidiphilus TaxID=182455 RepID=UPI00082BE1FE|nr:class I SAM-dependent methyltransferase [Alicyclobacillus acidiphilus]
MSDDDQREQLRTTFREDAELYHRARPTYPDELFDDLRRNAGIGQGCRVLEIGCGTGQLTVPLAERGCEIVAIDLGATTVEIAQRNLRQYPAVEVQLAAFEDWNLPDSPFDVVVSATAFHWLDPSIRVVKSADALHSGGVLAVISTHHIAGGDKEFFTDVQTCYRTWYGPSKTFSLPSADEIGHDTEEFDQSEKFQQAKVYRYEWEQAYSAVSYGELLLTYSDHRSLPLESRQGLIKCVSELINSKYNGSIRKRYMTQLLMLSRR